MSKWELYKIQDLIEQGVLYIGDGYRAKNDELGRSGLPFARGGNINNGFHFKDADYFPIENIRRVGVKVSQHYDVVFTSKGTVGRFAFVQEDTPQFVYSPQLCFWRVLNDKVISPRFLYYWMHGAEFFEQYFGVSFQTDMAGFVSLGDQRRMHITLPPLKEQQRIAHILSAFDGRIELNRCMNTTLEELARAIFKAWFVDFEPFGGTMPEDWRIGMLGEVTNNPRRGVLPQNIPPDTPYIGLDDMPRRSIALASHGFAGEIASNKFIYRSGEILFGKLRPYFHKVGIALQDGVCSTDILVMKPNDPHYHAFVVMLVSSDEFVAHTTLLSDGTKMPRTNWGAMAQYETAIPNDEAAQQFNDIVEPLLAKVKVNIQENQTLATLRDALMPKLLSADIRTDRVFEE